MQLLGVSVSSAVRLVLAIPPGEGSASRLPKKKGGITMLFRSPQKHTAGAWSFQA
jgi:hypothetical protein